MLPKIVETKQTEVAQLKRTTNMAAFLSEIRYLPPTVAFRQSLLNSPRRVSVIAEVKKASPSKGVIRESFHPAEIARAYAQAQAECISVLTDQPYFQGSLAYLREIRAAVSVPLLRKDFIIDELQIAEARANGADCILLIAAILDGQQLHHFSQVAQELALDVLIEVHDREELEKVFKSSQPALLGINNRNLRTFQTDLATTKELLGLVPRDVPVVSESGINSPADIDFLHGIGARAVLVGEHFMRQPDVRQAVVDLVGERQAAATGERS